MTEIFLNFPTVSTSAENFFDFSSSGFPHSQYKRVGISKFILSFFTLFFIQRGRALPFGIGDCDLYFSNTYE